MSDNNENQDYAPCLFARARSTTPGFDSVSMRIPALPGAGDDEEVPIITLVGDEARLHILKFHLGSAAGILSAAGFTHLATQVEKATPLVLGIKASE